MLTSLIIGVLLVSIGLLIFRIKSRKHTKNNIQSTIINKPDPQINKPEIIDTKSFCIFLDFEGVLFTNGNKDYRFLPNLCSVLDKFSGAEIVIASTYKDILPFSSIVELFEPQYRSRVIGVTPSVGPTRDAEIKEYITDHAIQNYVAIDDDFFGILFPQSCDYLFKTDSLRGLDEKTTEAFIEFIKTRLNG